MHHDRSTLAYLAAFLLISTTAFTAEQTVTGKVKAVDAAKNTITLDDLELDVSRKTKITLDGKKATLADVKKGQQAKVIYDDSLEAAISIVVGDEPEGDDEANAKVMKALQGEWKCIAMEEVGKTLDKKVVKEQDRRVTIKGHSYIMKRTEKGPRHTLVGKFEIDASNGHFDFVGKEQNGSAAEFVGIYELDGDTLNVCYRYKNNDECVRPKKFKTDDSKPNISVFYTFKRDKDE